MKKLKYLVAALLIGAVTLTGCGKKETISPEDAIKKAQNTMKTVDNYKMDMSVDAAIKAQGMSLEINLSLNGTIDEKNGKAKMTMTANALGMDINTEMYTDTKSEEGKSITYTKQEDGTWSKSVSERTEVNADVSDAMLEVINSGSNVKAVKADSKDVNTYEITIPAEKLASLMDMAGTNDVTSIDTSSLKGNVVLRVSIDKKTNNFTKLYMDMKDLLSSTMSENEDVKVEISKAEFTINFSDYNKAGDVTIPADVTENATEDEDDDYNFGDDDDFNFNFGTTEFNESDYEKVLKCTYTETNEDVKGEAIMNVGFKDSVATTIYSEQKYTFNSTEEAEAFYDDYETEDGENISRANNVVSVTSIAEKEDVEEDISYDEAKNSLEAEGFTCE